VSYLGHRLVQKFRGQSTHTMLTIAARLRPTASSADVAVTTALTVLRDLARRARSLEAEAAEHEAAIRAIVRSWRPCGPGARTC
jgi:hypothetical protein